ncbi:MAG: NAD(P)/FAD-dependent oxidoreductase [Aquificae bacterium]|nr:NAD(P)/FAD-dependent oxidoreductase [Aquificota bacterium]
MRYDVVVVGGGVSGLSCALTLASSQGRGWSWAEGKKFLVIDDGASDLKKALLNNVPGIPPGTLGKELLEKIRKQIQDMNDSTDFLEDTVVKIEGTKGNFKVYTKGGKVYEAEYVVLASGFHKFDIECEGVKVVENPKSPKPGRVMIEHDGDYKVREGLYVAGLLAGVSSMFGSASGTGVQVAINILSEWAGKPVVIHDVPDKD